MRGVAIGAAVLVVLAGVAAPAAAKCIPSTFRDGWLSEQEQLGGDTMGRHVGRSTSELIAHLATEPSIRETSSFPDPHTARLVISAALLPDERSFDSWARSAKPGERAELRMAFEQPIGVLVERGNGSGHPAHGLRIVLEAMGQGTCRLVTAYPTR